MTKLKLADLKLNTLYWCSEYYSPNEPRVLVRVKAIDGELVILEKLYTGELYRGLDAYVEFEDVHPQYIESNIRAKKADIERLTHELAILQAV